MPEPMTVARMVTAVHRGALTLAVDPEVRHFSAEAVALVFRQFCLNLAGAGSLDVAVERLAGDPALADVPYSVIHELAVPCLRHFAKALGAADG